MLNRPPLLSGTYALIALCDDRKSFTGLKMTLHITSERSSISTASSYLASPDFEITGCRSLFVIKSLKTIVSKNIKYPSGDS